MPMPDRMPNIAEAATPAAIQELAGMRPHATRIGPQEYLQRRTQAREFMAAAALDAVWLHAGTSLRYFTGLDWRGHERTKGMLLPCSGAPTLIVPEFEAELAASSLPADCQLRTWSERDNPFSVIAVRLGELGLASGTIGIEERTPFFLVEGLGAAAPVASLRGATAVTAKCRARKSGAELALLRAASQATWLAYRALWRCAQPGMTCAQLHELIELAYRALGVQGRASIHIDADTASPLPSRPQVRLRDNSLVLIDDGCTVEGYYGDITRTFVVGKPTSAMLRVFNAVRAAQDSALARARPGVAMGQVDAAARAALEGAGFAPADRYFPYRLGHGLGLDEHEWYYLSPDNADALQADMVLTNEPGIYLPGAFGIRLEDEMHVGELETSTFTSRCDDLERPFD